MLTLRFGSADKFRMPLTLTFEFDPRRRTKRVFYLNHKGSFFFFFFDKCMYSVELVPRRKNKGYENERGGGRNIELRFESRYVCAYVYIGTVSHARIKKSALKADVSDLACAESLTSAFLSAFSLSAARREFHRIIRARVSVSLALLSRLRQGYCSTCQILSHATPSDNSDV